MAKIDGLGIIFGTILSILWTMVILLILIGNYYPNKPSWIEALFFSSVWILGILLLCSLSLQSNEEDKR